MGHIKEPDGVDFIINGMPLTDKEKIARQKLRKTRSTNSKKFVTV